MAHELMGQRARDAGDRKPEDNLFEWRGVAGLEPLADKFANLLAADFFSFDLFPDFDWRVGGVAGTERRI